MTIQSLQKIISLEEELYASEQAEQKKIALWLKHQQDEILHQHKVELSALQAKEEKIKDRAAEEAKQKASACLLGAKEQADYLDSLDDDTLRHYLAEIHKYIAGQES